MILPEQLAQALDRIHPRDRELLSLSLRRRVPDEALGRVYDCPPAEVARRRARAIERVADALELQRGEDLGAVLQALLEPSTWSAAPSSVGEEFGAGRARLAAVPMPEDEEEGPEPPRGPALAPVPSLAEGDEAAPKPPVAAADPTAAAADPQAAPAASPEPGAAASPEPGAAASPEPAASPPADRSVQPGASPPADRSDRSAASPPGDRSAEPAEGEPVLEMLGARRREAPDPPRRALPLALIGLGIAALVGAAGVVGATQFGASDQVLRSGGDGGGTRHFSPQKDGPLAAPFPSDPRTTTSCYTTAYVRRPTQLYREPGGARRLKITARTEWGSPRVLGVVNQRGGWLGVQAPELRNGEVGWIRRAQARLDCVRWSLHADLSRRTLYVRQDGDTVRKFRIAIGRSENPTPKGRFSVTDRLSVTGSGSPYGCCVLALSGHQTNLPPYWPGGDRLAIHATDDESSIGKPVSLGCMRTQARQARWLIETIPLGAPIFISS